MRKSLILAANPKDQTRQRLGEEVRDIEEGLQRSRDRDQFQLAQRCAVRTRDIQRALLDESPQIVHFTGHSDGETGLMFESVTGEAQPVTSDALASLFSLFDPLQCVILDCDWFSAPFDKLQALPKNAEPVMNWPNLDQAFTDIAKGIRKVAESIDLLQQ